MKSANVWKCGAVRLLSLILAVTAALCCHSCGENESDDSSMTGNLLNSYMKGLCDYNIAAMNKCSMAKLDIYDDGESAVKACKAIASSIEWKSENISIDGNSAMAQISITVPEDIGAICSAAFDDTIKSLDKNSDATPSELLASYIKKRADKAEKTVISAEIAMTKVGNKWYIVKSLGVNRILSDIRTPVTAVFSLIDM